jgi:hypothetical protein
MICCQVYVLREQEIVNQTEHVLGPDKAREWASGTEKQDPQNLE